MRNLIDGEDKGSPNSKDGPRVMVIGLDGVPFEYLDPMLAAGQLPNLAGLIERGLRAPLHSVYPPMTPAAWPSFATGKNPGKHGVFGWWELVEGGSEPTILPVSAESIRGDTIWGLLSRSGLRVGVMNVPLTYPARQVNGFLIAGFDSPFEDMPSTPGLAYPPQLLAELEANGIRYKVLDFIESDLPLEASLLLESLDHWIAIEIEQTRAAKWLMERFSPHFMIIVYHIADYFMHRARRASIVVQRSLETLDHCVGALLEQCSEDTTVIVMSDHGSIELKKYIYLQNWMVSQGLLKFKNIVPLDNLEIIIKAELRRAHKDIAPDIIRALSDQLLSFWRWLPKQLQHDLTHELLRRFPACCMSDLNIDWANTRAFTISAYGEIYINVRGRQPGGIVDSGREYEKLVAYLIGELKKLRDPETGELVMANVVHKEDYYHGPQTEKAPDILCFLRDMAYYFMRYNYYMRPATTFLALQHSSNIVIESITPDDDFLGDHTPYGILIASGNAMKERGHLPPARIIDLTPTILALCGVPIPADMDGKVLDQWFRLPEDSPQFEPAAPDNATTRMRAKYSEETAQSLRRTLRLLGYKV